MKYLVTVDGQSFVREGALAQVAMGAEGAVLVLAPPLKAADPRDGDERRLMNALSTLFEQQTPAVAKKLARGELPSEQELSDAFGKVIEVELVETATNASLRLGEQVGVQFDPALVNDKMADWARTYTYELVNKRNGGLTDTTRRGLQQVMSRFAETPGMTRGELEEAISKALSEPGKPLSKARAEAIAVTETTRAYSASMDAYQQELAADGVQMEKVWHTANDELVCPQCGPLNGKPEKQWGGVGPPPRHVRCRCSTSLTMVDVDGTGELRRLNERGVTLARGFRGEDLPPPEVEREWVAAINQSLDQMAGQFGIKPGQSLTLHVAGRDYRVNWASDIALNHMPESPSLGNAGLGKPLFFTNNQATMQQMEAQYLASIARRVVPANAGGRIQDTVIHELAHPLYDALNDNQRARWQAVWQAGKNSARYPSGYWVVSPQEGFADTVAAMLRADNPFVTAEMSQTVRELIAEVLA